MVKRKTVRQKVGKKEAKKLAEKDAAALTSHREEVEPGVPIDTNSSLRLKRKLNKKMQFLSKIHETQHILGAKKVISKKKRGRKKSALNNLSVLAEVLPSVNEKSMTAKPHTLPKRNQARARQQLVVNEVKQLSKVLAHPQFKSNPFSAIHQHLVNTLSPLLEDTVKPMDKERSSKKRIKKRTKKHHDMEE